MNVVGPNFLLLYGSQTGQAQAIAENVVEKARMRGLSAKIMDMNSGTELLTSTHCLVVITSTTGDGDAPDNADEFVRRLHHHNFTIDRLSHLQYTVLGLGDTNYSNFCNCAKRVDIRLSELGARRFVESAFADDALSLEIFVEPWLESLWPALEACLKLLNNELKFASDDVPSQIQEKSEVEEASDVDSAAVLLAQLHLANEPDQLLGDDDIQLTLLAHANLTVPAILLFSLETKRVSDEVIPIEMTAGQNPACLLPCAASEVYSAPLVGRQLLTSSDATKSVFLVEFDISSAPWHSEWRPGDSFGIIVPNPIDEVTSLLTRLGINRSAADRPLQIISNGKRLPAHLPTTLTCWRNILTYCVDIRSTPGAPLLRLLAEHTNAPRQHRRLLELCSREALRLRAPLLNRRSLSLLDLLLLFPAAKPPPHRLLQLLPRLQPRPYSAASSPLAQPLGRLKLVFTAVHIPATDGRQYERRGLCTGYLQDIVPNRDTVPIFLRKNATGFGLPTEPSPILLICAGAGVAPFRCFLEHLQLQQQKYPEVWLVQGCRRRHQDQLFAKELEKWCDLRILTNYFVATSREEPNEYVQDLLRAKCEEVARLIVSPESRVMVCGDASGLAKGVAEALQQVLVDGAQLDLKQATQILTDMRLQRRYQEDVWT